MPPLNFGRFVQPGAGRPEPAGRSAHPPRILLLYGSLRERSYSRLLVEQADRLLRLMGCDTRIYDPWKLPVAGSVSSDHSKVQELRELSQWSEGQVWCSPEMHGQMTGVFKNQIDWIPLEVGGMRPAQGRTLAVMQVNAGSQSFNAVNTMRILGRWMRMVTIPNQSSVPKAYEQFDEAGRMLPFSLYGGWLTSWRNSCGSLGCCGTARSIWSTATASGTPRPNCLRSSRKR